MGVTLPPDFDGSQWAVVAGTPAGPGLAVDDLARHVVDIAVEDAPGEIVVLARRTRDDGGVRAVLVEGRWGASLAA